MRGVVRFRSVLGRMRIAPATVVATVALVFAAGGGAYAGTTSSRSGPTVMWAVVNSNGTLARSSGGVNSTEVTSGQYQVLFSRKVRKCAYVATPGSTTTTNTPIGQIGVGGRQGHSNGVFVLTEDSSGALTSLPFHLVVTCG